MKRENRPSAPKHVIKKKKDNIANQLQSIIRKITKRDSYQGPPTPNKQ